MDSTISLMDRMRASSHLAGPNASYIEELYEAYLDSPSRVPEVWRSYFDTLPIVDGAVGPDTPHTTVIEHFETVSYTHLTLPTNREV